jgi:tetratricopeptide (TPR) repeat protein
LDQLIAGVRFGPYYSLFQDAWFELGDLESSLIEYKCAITIYERMLGKFHVKMANIYSKLAGILMDKGEYEGALSFYCKAYGIYDTTLGLHDDTKQALMNVKLAAEKDRGAKSSMDILAKVEAEFKKRHPEAGDGDDNKDDDDADETDDKDGGDGKKKDGTKKKKKKKKADKNGDKAKGSEEEFDII